MRRALWEVILETLKESGPVVGATGRRISISNNIIVLLFLTNFQKPQNPP